MGSPWAAVAVAAAAAAGGCGCGNGHEYGWWCYGGGCSYDGGPDGQNAQGHDRGHG